MIVVAITKVFNGVLPILAENRQNFPQQQQKKTLDKQENLWYNIDVKREEKEKSKVCAEKKFFGNAEKRLDKTLNL